MIVATAQIDTVPGDIAGKRVDAIVTAADASPPGGGGADRAVHRAAGPGSAIDREPA